MSTCRAIELLARTLRPNECAARAREPDREREQILAARLADNDSGASQADRLRVSVADQGPGVPPEERERIFEPFYRPPGTTPDVRGTGLGLSIARGLAVAQGGWVEFEPRILVAGRSFRSCFRPPMRIRPRTTDVSDRSNPASAPEPEAP